MFAEIIVYSQCRRIVIVINRGIFLPSLNELFVLESSSDFVYSNKKIFMVHGESTEHTPPASLECAV